MARLVLLLAVGAVAIGVAGCGGSSGATTDSGVSLPSQMSDGEGRSGMTQSFQEYYEELVEAGATPKVARCYRTHLEALPQDELEEFLSPGEISKSANARLFEFNERTEAACVGKGGPFNADASPQEQERIIQSQASNFGHILEARGVADDVISCVTEGIEALPYALFLKGILREAAGQNALRKIGEECNVPPTE